MQKRWQCSARHPRRQFSIKVGTIFEDSPIGLDKWLPVMWQIVNCKNGVSSREIHRAIGVTQKTAWFMLQRGRLAMQDKYNAGMLDGEVEVDETSIGGRARNLHKGNRDALKRDVDVPTGGGGKGVVIGAIERKGRIRATVASYRKKKTI